MYDSNHWRASLVVVATICDVPFHSDPIGIVDKEWMLVLDSRVPNGLLPRSNISACTWSNRMWPERWVIPVVVKSIVVPGDNPARDHVLLDDSGHKVIPHQHPVWVFPFGC